MAVMVLEMGSLALGAAQSYLLREVEEKLQWLMSMQVLPLLQEEAEGRREHPLRFESRFSLHSSEDLSSFWFLARGLVRTTRLFHLQRPDQCVALTR